MFTRKAGQYFLLAILLLIIALALQDWQFAVLILPIAALFFLANAWGIPEKLQLQYERRIVPSESFGEENIRVDVHIENREKTKLENLEFHDLLPEGILPGKGTNRAIIKLDPLQSTSISYELQSPGRGHHKVGPGIIRVQDILGLYLSERRIEYDTFVVMPRPERMAAAGLRPRHVGPWTGTIPARATGPGGEFYSLREYQPGDEPRRINWKISAKARRLIVNETESEKVTDVMILIDTDVTFFEATEVELFERSIRAAASMASLLLRQGNRVGLILQGEERGIVRPSFGKRHERRILYTLALARPGKAMVSTSYVVTLLARLTLPTGAQIVIISPVLDPGIGGGVRDLVTDGYSVMVLSPTPAEPSVFDSNSEKVAFKIKTLERANTLLSLEKTCTVVEWPPGVSLLASLRRVRRIRPALRPTIRA